MTMPPREKDPLLGGSSDADLPVKTSVGFDGQPQKNGLPPQLTRTFCGGLIVGVVLCATAALALRGTSHNGESSSLPFVSPAFKGGPYALFQDQTPATFLDFWEFYAGEDSVGSAGYQTYVDKKTASANDLVQTSTDDDGSFLTIRSVPDETEPRLSIRLEGTHRFDTGLFVIELDHVPTGCGVWPALWLTDESNWPVNGEIDFIESVNRQTAAATALHTSAQCNMYAHVPASSMTGTWDRATGIPDSFTGVLDTSTNLPADNCWTQAAHQWANQGCVVRADPAQDTMGAEWNKGGGGVYALEWDPAYERIRSWAFPAGSYPDNVQAILHDAGEIPDTDLWGLPYARFAIGKETGCSADHFRNMRLVLNTAFCGTVAGNRFARDGCAVNVTDPIEACNAYVASQPHALEAEAHWKIRGLKVYLRT